MGIEKKIKENLLSSEETLSEKYNKRRQKIAEMLYNGESNRKIALSCMLMYFLIAK